jgi:SAM-dependent methyltransferase
MESMSDLGKNLVILEEGIWASGTSGPISYPYDGNANCFAIEDRSFWFRHRNDCIVDTVRRYPPRGTIFDIGGGNGYVASCLGSNGFPTALVEPGIDGARNGRSRGIRDIICSTLEDAGFVDRGMPAAGLFDVLEHFEDDTGILKTLHRCLADDGRLYLTVPAYPALWSKEDERARHYRRYSMRGLTRKLVSSGFTVEYSTYFFALLVAPIFVFRTLPGMLGRVPEDDSRHREKEHAPGKTMRSIVDRLLGLERLWMSRGRIPCGASCLVVATPEA